MFEKWDSRRDITAVDYADFGLIELFSFLAYEIFGEIQKEDGVGKNWVNEKCYEYFLNWYESKPKAKERATEISEFICGRAWLMSRFGPDSYRFSHRTFLEYFFANELVSRNEKVSVLLSLILKNIQKSNWNVVSHLALQQKTWRKNHYVQEAFDSLGSSFKAGKPTKIKKSKIKFSAEATEYLRGPEKVYRKFCYDIINEIISCKDTGLMCDAFRSLVKNSRDRERILYEEIDKIISESIDKDQYQMINNILSLVGSNHFTIFYEGGKKNRIGFYGSGDIGLEIDTEKYKKEILDKARLSHDWAIVYLSEFCDNIENLFSRHGYNIFSAKNYLDKAIGISSVLDRMVLGKWNANRDEVTTFFPVRNQSINFEKFDAFSIIFDDASNDLEALMNIDSLQTTMLSSFVSSFLSSDSHRSLRINDTEKIEDLKKAVLIAIISERHPDNHHMWLTRGKVLTLIKRGFSSKKKTKALDAILSDGELEMTIKQLGLLSS